MGYAETMRLRAGQAVREIGADDDTDDEIRDDVRRVTGRELLDDTSEEVADAVLWWWREGDGDLVSELTDEAGPLVEGGSIWVLTPRQGKPGHIPVLEMAELADDAGLRVRVATPLGSWTGHDLYRP
ncbi:DUF3052 family protein [Streptomyces sp. R302]|uniref:DUF3052 family protein n=1 Tax=unclassified Streptomyces TaxID=2593676 RepID=UPI00145EC56C|nr:MULTISPECIES: DUF3052 family protein [unclassified Streptomyces]NML49798.1 DUF3052 family protein [Streptomyces sp. R301]NML78125.1 DUF3052 family protein [Streptomyces sp. R302]